MTLQQKLSENGACPVCHYIHGDVCGPAIPITIEVPEHLAYSLTLDFPLSYDEYLDHTYDSGTVWAAFELANIAIKKLPQKEYTNHAT